MNHLLFRDAFRRLQVHYAVLAGVSAMFWFLAAWAGFPSVGMLLALSMVATAVIGPAVAGQRVAPREVWLLPIGRRDIWRTRWWLTGPVVVGVALVGKIVGLAVALAIGAIHVTLQTIIISSLLDFAFVGIEIWLTPLTEVIGPRIGQRRGVRHTAASTLFIIVVLLNVTTPVLPLGVQHDLPTLWTDFTLAWSVAITFGIACLAAGYFYRPRLGARPSAAATRAALQTHRPSRWPSFAAVTGVRRLMLRTWITVISFQATLPFFMMGVFRLMDTATGDTPEPWLNYAGRFGMLPFTSGEGLGLPWLMLSLFSSMGTESVTNMLRHLRTLPLGTRRLNLTLIAISVVAWVNAWFVLAAFHVIATNEPFLSWRLPMFLAFAGLDSALRAVHIRFRGRSGFLFIFPVIVGIGVGVGVSVTKFGIPAAPAYLVSGASAFAFAIWLNERTLTRRRDVYAAPSRTVFGVEAPTP